MVFKKEYLEKLERIRKGKFIRVKSFAEVWVINMG